MGRTIKAGDIITVDGATGQVFAGSVDMIQPELVRVISPKSWTGQMRREL